MSQRIFQSEEHQATFDKQGFLVLPFLEKEDIAYLNELFDSLHPHLHQGGFFSGSYSQDLKYKKEASDKIVAVFQKAYEKYFTNFTPFGAAFLYKVPGFGEDLPIHQDWTIVNEEEAVALNCWVPLQDINETNGALHIVPGTHYDKVKTLRSPTIPFFFSGHDELVVQAAVPMYVKAGEAVILNQSVIHGSAPNKSDAIRKAITAGVKTKGAQMYFHYKVPKKDELEVFAMDDNFLISFNNFANDIGQRPYLGKSVGFKSYQSPQLEKTKLLDMIEKTTNEAGFAYIYPKGSEQLGLFKRLFQKIF
ncbi:MAG: phytanoyl-CoA dioxygenase family protein [Chitinophagales bacterium]|nr:phytanoyl-CoA dioxygenase family protein [Chitinophagales bacterium]